MPKTLSTSDVVQYIVDHTRVLTKKDSSFRKPIFWSIKFFTNGITLQPVCNSLWWLQNTVVSQKSVYSEFINVIGVYFWHFHYKGPVRLFNEMDQIDGFLWYLVHTFFPSSFLQTSHLLVYFACIYSDMMIDSLKAFHAKEIYKGCSFENKSCITHCELCV